MLTALPNQRSTESVGTWMWRYFTTSIVSGDDVIFEVEDNVMILDFILVVVTASTGGTSLDADVEVANTAGDVALESSIDLQAAATTVYDRATAAGTITDHNGTPIQLKLANVGTVTAATCWMGVLAARLDYDADA